ncbi:MAG: sugar ABC transporter permease [Firmicutes bacterium]|nr:sugar ABC transporter permease [Bacillota bacterium]
MDPPRFIGLKNYMDTLSRPIFQSSLVKTIVFTIFNVGIQFFLGFAVALLLDTRRHSRKFFLTLCILPMMITPSIVGLIWKVLLHNEWGIANYFIETIGLTKLGWLSDPTLTLVTIVLVEVWLHTPFTTLVLLAGLQAIPPEPYEAAKVDGASGFQAFRYITLPWLQPLIVIVLMFRIMFSLRAFDTIYSLFRSGGPGNEGMVLGVYLYERLRITWSMGEAAALSYIILFLTALFSMVFVVKLYRGEQQ